MIGIISNENLNYPGIDFGNMGSQNVLQGFDINFSTRMELIESNFFQKSDNKKYKKNRIYYKNEVYNHKNKNRTYCLFPDECVYDSATIDKAYISFTKNQWNKWKTNNAIDHNYGLITYSFVKITPKFENYQINKCLNRRCVERNPYYYNSLLGGPKKEYKDTKSGYSMLNFLPNVLSSLPNRVVDSRHANCPGANPNNAGCQRSEAYIPRRSGGYSQVFTGDMVCPTNKEPVCGVNGKTFINGCMAKKHGINVDYYGPCKTIEDFSNYKEHKIGEYIASIILIVVAILIFLLIFFRKNK